MIRIKIIPALRDNYIYLVFDEQTVGVIDPGQVEPVLDCLKRNFGKYTLDYIFNTHHHYDHVGGNLILKQATDARVVGNVLDKHRIPGIDICVNNTFLFGSKVVTVIPIPGHTHGHIAFYFVADKVLFCGDTLFSSGCGRLFEGTAQEMYSSLQMLLSLPEETLVYCGHEYTLSNINFALTVEPNNQHLRAYKQIATERRIKDLPTMPTSLKQEKLINPFLRTHSIEIRQNLHMPIHSDIEVFMKLRRLKDSFS